MKIEYFVILFLYEKKRKKISAEKCSVKMHVVSPYGKRGLIRELRWWLALSSTCQCVVFFLKVHTDAVFFSGSYFMLMSQKPNNSKMM